MFRLHRVEVIVFIDVEEGEQTAVNPSATLLHQVLVVLHGICLCYCVRNVFKIIFFFSLAVNSQGEDTILSQIHVGLPIVLLFHVRIQNHLEVAVLKQIRFIFV